MSDEMYHKEKWYRDEIEKRDEEIIRLTAEVERLKEQIRYKDSVIDQRNTMLSRNEKQEPCEWEKNTSMVYDTNGRRWAAGPSRLNWLTTVGYNFCPMCGRRLEGK